MAAKAIVAASRNDVVPVGGVAQDGGGDAAAAGAGEEAGVWVWEFARTWGLLRKPGWHVTTGVGIGVSVCCGRTVGYRGGLPVPLGVPGV